MNDPEGCTTQCANCGDTGETLKRDGEEYCGDCLDETVVFVAKCEPCGWSYECGETVFNRSHARVRVQQEVNNHNSRKRVFGHLAHDAEWFQREGL